MTGEAASLRLFPAPPASPITSASPPVSCALPQGRQPFGQRESGSGSATGVVLHRPCLHSLVQRLTLGMDAMHPSSPLSLSPSPSPSLSTPLIGKAAAPLVEAGFGGTLLEGAQGARAQTGASTKVDLSEFPQAFVRFLEENGINPAVYEAGKSIPRHIRLRRQWQRRQKLQQQQRSEHDSEVASVEGDDVADVVRQVEAELGVQLDPLQWLPDFFCLPPDTHIASAPSYKRGQISGMDAASGAAVSALNLQPGDNVLDLCTAPGTKLAMMADILGPTGTLTAVDVSQPRLAATRTLLVKHGCADRCRLFLGDATGFRVLPPGAAAPAGAGRSQSSAGQEEKVKGSEEGDSVCVSESLAGVLGEEEERGVNGTAARTSEGEETGWNDTLRGVKENSGSDGEEPVWEHGSLGQDSADVIGDAEGPSDRSVSPPHPSEQPSKGVKRRKKTRKERQRARRLRQFLLPQPPPNVAPGGGAGLAGRKEVGAVRGWSVEGLSAADMCLAAAAMCEWRGGVTGALHEAKTRAFSLLEKGSVGVREESMHGRDEGVDRVEDMQQGNGVPGCGLAEGGWNGVARRDSVPVLARVREGQSSEATLRDSEASDHGVSLSSRDLQPPMPVEAAVGPELFFVGRTGHEWWDPSTRGDPRGYDKVVVDAECTHDGSVKHVMKLAASGWDSLHDGFLNHDRLASLASLQRRLLATGFSLLRKGGRLLYCTCSLTQAQNEEVVSGFLRLHQDARVVKVEAASGWPCRSGSIPNSLRFDPITSQTGGLFVVLLTRD